MYPKDSNSYQMLKLKLIFNLITLIITSITGLIGMYMIINYKILQLLNLTAMETVGLIVGLASIFYLRKTPTQQQQPQYPIYPDNYSTPSCNYPHCKKEVNHDMP